MGQRASNTSAVYFEDVAVPDEVYTYSRKIVNYDVSVLYTCHSAIHRMYLESRVRDSIMQWQHLTRPDLR